MTWKAIIAAALSLLAAGAAVAQEAPPPGPVTTNHTLALKGRSLSYTATAGLMPINTSDGALIGDMFYAAYTAPAKRGETRPVAFVWNGGSGANTTPLHYGAFGPKRLANGALKPNEATLLDVADLVFLDQIETGFGRYAENVDRRAMLNQRVDANTFAAFIETYLRENGGVGRPTILIGESYGVRRAQLVTEELLKRRIAPEALVLISGYSLVGKRLEPAADGAFRVPGYAALSLRRGLLEDTRYTSEADIHDAAVEWADDLFEKLLANDPSARADFARGLKDFLGYSDEQIAGAETPLNPQATTASLANLSRQHATLLFQDIRNPISYDMRAWDDDGRGWISRAIIDDLRKTLGFNPDRVYVGQEFDNRSYTQLPFVPRQPMKVTRADGSIVELTPETAHLFPELQEAMSSLPLRPGVGPAQAEDGLALSLVNFAAHFGASLSISDSPMPELMAAAPEMEIFIAGGMYDDLVSCAVGVEMARRDLADVADRVRTKCYAGGHMMYEEEAEGAILSEDVRGFIRAVQAGDRSLGVAVTP